MHVEPEPNVPTTGTQQEQLFARLKPESELEERLVRQIALCTHRLESIEALLAKAEEQLHMALADSKDALSP
jgi:hypothetical protein